MDKKPKKFNLKFPITKLKKQHQFCIILILSLFDTFLFSMSQGLYKFDYLRGECQPRNAGLLQVWRCQIFFKNVKDEWEQLAKGTKIEFVYSNFMGKFRGGYTSASQLKLVSCKDTSFWFTPCSLNANTGTVKQLKCDNRLNSIYDGKIKVDYRCHRATDSETKEAAEAMEEIGLESSRVIKEKKKPQPKNKNDPKKTQRKAYRTLAKFVRQFRRSSKSNN